MNDRAPWQCPSCGKTVMLLVSVTVPHENPGGPGHMKPVEERWCLDCVLYQVGISATVLRGMS